VGLQRIWDRVRKAADLEGVRVHDLRHTTASIAVQGGASLKLVGGLLGHKSPLTANRYSHLSDDPAAALAERVASQIAAFEAPRAVGQ
jgi:integrase